jgi:hypothetical protein
MANPRANGFSDIVMKPYSIEDLGDTLFSALIGGDHQTSLAFLGLLFLLPAI